ncbi:MAG: RnfABCDGE type electron transport complex subunit D [Gammaproteobacteria bacterium]
MRFATAPAPHLIPPSTVPEVMRQVLIALVPAAVAYVWFFGFGLIANLIIAAAAATGTEALMLRLRRQSTVATLNDYSALVTAALLAFTLPPLTPWYVTAAGTVFAIAVAKHLFGGIGFNPFNPAMAGYVVLLVSFPLELNRWLPPNSMELAAAQLTLLQSLQVTFTGALPAGFGWDAVTMATPLDEMQTGLKLKRMVPEILSGPAYGGLGGAGWGWLNLWFAAGGLWLLYRGVIRWHIPVSMLAGLGLMAALFHLADADTRPSMMFHLLSGATMLGAFFIATDPVSAATSIRGRLVYGAGIGILTYVIRAFAKYPDGLAFAVLIMNAAVPAIDYFTRTRVYGNERR